MHRQSSSDVDGVIRTLSSTVGFFFFGCSCFLGGMVTACSVFPRSVRTGARRRKRRFPVPGSPESNGRLNPLGWTRSQRRAQIEVAAPRCGLKWRLCGIDTGGKEQGQWDAGGLGGRRSRAFKYLHSAVDETSVAACGGSGTAVRITSRPLFASWSRRPPLGGRRWLVPWLPHGSLISY